MDQREKSPEERKRVGRSHIERRNEGVKGKERGKQAVVREMEERQAQGEEGGKYQREEGGKAQREEGTRYQRLEGRTLDLQV